MVTGRRAAIGLAVVGLALLIGGVVVVRRRVAVALGSDTTE